MMFPHRFPQLTAISGLQFRECQRYLSELVSTFNLTADTVTFRPNEVPLLNLLLALLYVYTHFNLFMKN